MPELAGRPRLLVTAASRTDFLCCSPAIFRAHNIHPCMSAPWVPSKCCLYESKPQTWALLNSPRLLAKDETPYQ